MFGVQWITCRAFSGLIGDTPPKVTSCLILFIVVWHVLNDPQPTAKFCCVLGRIVKRCQRPQGQDCDHQDAVRTPHSLLKTLWTFEGTLSRLGA